MVDYLGLERPFGFGHSCGGAAVLLAEQARPGLFRSLYCFEPVVMPDAARAHVAAHNPLADGARRRRETFPSAEDALANYASKPPYRELDPEALRLYVESGFELVPADEGGDGRAVRLRCRRHDEADTFAAAGDHDAFAHLHEVSCPVTLCCGEETDAFGVRLMKADAEPIPDGRVEVAGGHGTLRTPPAAGCRGRSGHRCLRGRGGVRTGRAPRPAPPAGPGAGTPAS